MAIFDLRKDCDPQQFGLGVKEGWEVPEVRSRRPAVPSRHRRDSCPSDEVVGGLFFDFEAVRTESSDRDAPRR